MTASMIGPYEIRAQLGKGGIGEVYEAIDTLLGRPVAIKALRPEFSRDQMFLERFRAEATNLARLNHPNVTTLFSLHREGEEMFMVMELVRGHTLEALIARIGRLGGRAALAVLAQVVAGLGYAHRMGLIHRDIKPANLMVTPDGLVKIMDFGIARIRGSQRLTRQGEMVGTLAYMAPEQFKGAEGDEKTDLYSLAIVVYEMLSGHVPFNADSEYDLIRAQVETPPPPLHLADALVEPGVEGALMQALAKAPHDRFASVDAFGRAMGTSALLADAQEIVRTEILAPLAATPAPTRILRSDLLAPAAAGPEPAAPTTIERAAFQPPPTRIAPLASPAPAAAAAPASRGRLPLLAGFAALVLVAGGAGAYAVFRPAPAPPPAVIADNNTPPPAPPVAPVGPAPQPVIIPPLQTAPLKAAPGQPDATPPEGALPGAKGPAPHHPKPGSATAGSRAPEQAAPVAAKSGRVRPPPAARPATAIVGSVRDIWDNGSFAVGEKRIQLYGINPIQGPPGILSAILRGDTRVACYPVKVTRKAIAATYEARCKTRPRGIDLGRMVLWYGGAKTLAGAPQDYRVAEREARLAHRGMWASSNN